MEKSFKAHAGRIAVKDDVLAADLAGEAVIANLRNGVYYGLEGVGYRIWSLIQEQRTVEEILNAILEDYDVERDRCEQDLMVLLKKLADEGLIEVR